MPKTDKRGKLLRPDGIEIRPRVYLREPTAGDNDEIIARGRASRTLHRGWVSPPVDARGFARWMARARQPSVKVFLVCRLDDGAIVGIYTLSQIFRGAFQSAYLGYHAYAPFAAQGYMREAMTLVLRQVFTRMKLHRVEANVQPENAASVALVKRAGFRLEGFSPRYLKVARLLSLSYARLVEAMLSDDWQRLRLQRRGASPRPSRRAPRASSSPGRRCSS